LIRQESLYVTLNPQPGSSRATSTPAMLADRLHVRRIFADKPGPPVLLLHGAVENSRIFYTESGKGLGPYLANRGFDVYACDLRGRGKSTPPISRSSQYGQLEAITEDIPAFMELVRLKRGDVPVFWGAHSWGGVLLLSYLARFKEAREQVAGTVFFGTKRSVHVRNWERKLKVDLVWNKLCPFIVKTWGYLPGRKLRIGSDSETKLSQLESKAWVEPSDWVDPRDGFDYAAAAKSAELPPMLFLAGHRDRALGHPQDVRALIRELGPQEVEFRLLGRHTGALHDYGHIDMLTHPDAVRDHFPEAVRFLKAQARMFETK
jgi:pimeloyl-ACP methyl ester carboxylesterase